MRGEKYLSGMGKLRVTELREEIVRAYNEYFPDLFPLTIRDCDEKIVSNVLAGAMERSDMEVGEKCLDFFALQDRACSAYWKNNLIVIGS